jgi:hypothetical protein
MNRRPRFLANGIAWLAYVALLCLSIYFVSSSTLQSMHSLKWDTYGFSDLLVNYDGGFVRRGLLGAIIKKHTISQTSSLPYLNRFVFNDFLVLAFSLTILILISAKRSGIVALLVLTMPGGIFSMALYNEYFYRKEILFYIALCVVACMISVLQRLEDSGIKRALGWATISLIFFSGLVLPLIHESFLFLSAPTHAFLLYAAAREIQSKHSEQEISTKLPRTATQAYLGIQVILFLLLLQFKGSPGIVETMWAKLLPADRALLIRRGEMTAFQAIGWGLLHQVIMQIHVIVSGFLWYWLVPLTMGFLYCLALTSLGKKSRADSAAIYKQTSRWVSCYLTLLICVSPLFLLGWDWGRWLLAANISFVILWLALEPRNLGTIADVFPRFSAVLAPLHNAVELLQKAAGTFVDFGYRYRGLLIASMLVFAVTFRVPEACLGNCNLPTVLSDVRDRLKNVMSYRTGESKH